MTPEFIIGPEFAIGQNFTPGQEFTIDQQDQLIADTVARDTPRLRSFIRSRLANTADAEDILQDVFYELISAYRFLRPAEEVTAWLFRVARNRITDLFRRIQPESLSQSVAEPNSGGQDLTLEDLLPSPDAGPDALYTHTLLYDALEDALAELPADQREVFLAHEFEGRTFKDLAAETGTPINTLLSRKRYAILHLRKRLTHINETINDTINRP